MDDDDGTTFTKPLDALDAGCLWGGAWEVDEISNAETMRKVGWKWDDLRAIRWSGAGWGAEKFLFAEMGYGWYPVVALTNLSAYVMQPSHSITTGNREIARFNNCETTETSRDRTVGEKKREQRRAGFRFSAV